ncbi:MAG: HIT domain-containing protein [Roseitalea sp.]|jgi:diadenosine tetraphosphate (Ap4A) HIT family hydrolase|uniref:HIT domain-containing protein n=1 Tax=Oceaniradius stylonematis TaxID=2184161 RepID=A0A3A8AF05_9HYPH|nr:HIT family protein [Oceaniradius stylonematis]MBO6553390.1 HIT domain-containing protein [Roseitalea sp.]MBO6952433.1 HIT domain-containing protein [Rhizobiaceae bacterium]RNC91338.1 MAG: HIT domain-containing protein [Oricola sp.]MBO6593081.1 HIT domain-containing protein [Roseitalea sp.]MBO6600177.1 HIT domain-containing protein [Roseitalea sp.]
MTDFELDPTLERDSLFVTDLGLTQLRLMNDSRFAWLILVPKRSGITEIHELTPLDQTMLTFETTQIAQALADVTGADKINVAALGNQVRQLHMHVIARHLGDPAWPGPVWCAGTPTPYQNGAAKAFIERFSNAF